MNYDDIRIKKLEEEKQATLDKQLQHNQSLLDKNKEFETEQLASNEAWRLKQEELLKGQEELARQRTEMNKQEADKSARAEGIKADTDYQKFINRYGVQREQEVSMGLGNTGYSETVKGQTWGKTQDRISLAKTTAEKIKAEYDMKMQEAKQNFDLQLAENNQRQYEQKMAILLQSFQQESAIKQGELDYQRNLNNDYYARYQDVFAQQRYEKEQAENLRRYNEEMALQKQQINQQQSNWEREFNLARSSSGGSSGGGTTLNYEDTQQTQTAAQMFGTFSNGYQPKGVAGDGKFVKTAGKVKDIYANSAVSTKGTPLGNQNIHVTQSGRYYVWDGSIKQYIDITEDYKRSKTQKVNIVW